MTRRSHRSALAGLFAAAAMLAMAAPAAASERWPDPSSGRDMVTGYLCVGQSCDTVRLPGTDCLCQKENPAQMDFRQLRLTCYASEGGRWVSCPVQPRPGEVYPPRR
jgi:hypothetical protein